MLTLHNVIILVKSILDKDRNRYYCKIFLEKYLYQLAKKQSQNLFSYYNNVENWREKKIAKEKFYVGKKHI